MAKPLEKEYEYYLEIREELIQNHRGKFVAIVGEEVIGIFDDYRHAAEAVYVDHEYGTVLVQEIGRDVEYFTGIFPAAAGQTV